MCLREVVDEAGLTLLEVIIAVFVLSVAVMALAGVAITSLASVRISRDRDLASSAASAVLEAARAVDFEQLAMNDADSPPATFSHDGSTSEPTVVASDGAITPFACTPADPSACWFEYGPYAGRHSVTTYVTWFDDPTVEGTKNGRRVTAVVTWDDPGVESTRTVRQSTVVAEARRGLGQPDFTISNPDQSTVVPEDTDACFRHLLTNFGADDHFQFTIRDGDGVKRGVVGEFAVQATNTSDSKSWNARSWLGPAAYQAAGDWRDTRNDGVTDEQMQESETGSGTDPSNEWLGNVDVLVAKDTTAELEICYTPESDINGPKTHTFEALIRSEFAASLNSAIEGQTLQHTITVDDTAVGWYLTEDRDLVLEVPPDRLLPDYDADGIPGLGLTKPAVKDTDGEAATWASTRPDGDKIGAMTLVLFTSWDEAIEFGSTQSKDISYRVRVCVDRPTEDGGAESCLDTTEGTDSDKYTASVTETETYTHSSAGWVEGNITLSFPEGTVTVPGGEHVRIKLTCLSPTSDKGEDCHFAYHTQTLDSRLVVQ